METMKAAVCTSYGGPEVLQIKHVPKPCPKEDEVLIRIEASSVTRSDLFIRGVEVPLLAKIFMRLAIGVKRPRNAILGEVLAGVIEEAGTQITRFKPGDKVYGLTGFSFGGYGEYTCMKEKDSKRGVLSIMPGNISFEDATAAAYGGLLALQFMEKGSLQPGLKVLIYGASGTSGIVALQLAKSLGVEVTAVCGPSNRDFIQKMGADKVLDYTRPESVSELEQYDFILDAVGKAKSSPLKKAAMKALNKKGLYSSIDDEALLLDSKRLDRVSHLVVKGILRPVTSRVYTLDQIAEAHEYVEKGHKRGNVALRIQSPSLISTKAELL